MKTAQLGLAACASCLCVMGLLAFVAPARAQCESDPPSGSRLQDITCYSSHIASTEPVSAVPIPLQIMTGEVSEDSLARWIRDNWPKA